jgi:hypothetical protein
MKSSGNFAALDEQSEEEAAKEFTRWPARRRQLFNFSQGQLCTLPRGRLWLSALARGLFSSFGAEVQKSSRPLTRPRKRKRRLAFRNGSRELDELVNF